MIAILNMAVKNVVLAQLSSWSPFTTCWSKINFLTIEQPQVRSAVKDERNDVFVLRGGG